MTDRSARAETLEYGRIRGQRARTDVVQPDILFVARGREHILERVEIVGAPDLVVEILSPGTEERDRTYKHAAYARAGVREYWIGDPEAEHVDVFRLGSEGFGPPARLGRGDTLVSAVVPELSVPLVEVFRPA